MKSTINVCVFDARILFCKVGCQGCTEAGGGARLAWAGPVMSSRVVIVGDVWLWM